MSTTPPLTAEEALKEIYKACDYGDSHGVSAAEWLEAYAAQQNAELVADVKLLRAALILQTEVISSYDVMEKSIKALAATDRPEYKEVE